LTNSCSVRTSHADDDQNDRDKEKNAADDGQKIGSRENLQHAFNLEVGDDAHGNDVDAEQDEGRRHQNRENRTSMTCV